MVKAFFIEALNSKFIRSVATLASGKTVAQAVTISAIPFIARFFLPEEFGVASLFWAIVIVIVAVANFGFDYAILLPKEESEARSLSKISLACTCATSTVLFLIIFGLKLGDFQFSWLEQLGDWVYLMPLGVALLGMTSIVMALSTRLKQFKSMAAADIAEATTVSGLRLITGFFGFGVFGLVTSLLLGASIKLAIVYKSITTVTVSNRGTIDLATKQLIRKYRQFPLNTMPTRLINIFGQHLPTIALAAIFGPAVAGLYAMGNRLLNLPVRLFADSLRRAYVQKAAELHEAGSGIFRPLVKVSVGLALLGAVIYTPVYFLGEWLFSFALGENWSEAGIYAEILSPLLFVMFFRSPSSATYVVLKKQYILLRMHIISISVFLGIFLYSNASVLQVEETLRLYSWAGVIFSLAVISIAILIAHKSEKERQ